MKIYCNSIRNEYDIRPLILSFYPGCNIEYIIDEHAEDKYSKLINDREVIAVIILENDYISVISGETIRKKEIEPERCNDAKEYRDILKRHIYTTFKTITGKENKWGTLTGVRPSKIPMAFFKQGYTREQAIKEMTERYFCAPEKAALCTDIAAVESDILEKTDYKNGYSIYIGIPFCPTVCNYCSFSSMSLAHMKNADNIVEDYLTALGKECSQANGLFPDKRITSIYVGGGTPTALDGKNLDALMNMIHKNFKVDNSFEFCVEAGRPDSINREKLKILKQAGVTRISVNPQTMKQETLSLMGRHHTVDQTIKAYGLAREMGFDNINMDLIAGLMDETFEDFKNTIDMVALKEPDSVTIHSLVIKRASQYRKQYEETEHSLNGTSVEKMLEYAVNCMFKHGYRPYYMYRQKNKVGLGDNSLLENIGYAKPGKEGIYNILIMEEKQPIIAYGAGASSKFLFGDRIERVANVKNVREYIDRIDEMIDRKKKVV